MDRASAGGAAGGPPTAGFIEGRPPAILEIDVDRYTTMLGKTLIAMAAAPVA